ncbi:MAG TPA: outer membrane beta-barrel protein [Blastocatellia bacterium]|nr:outer membrane beta-barrel protein [Blastocatellia bacterium]
MKKYPFLVLFVVLCLPLAAAAQEEAPRVEISGGYMLLRLNTGAIPADAGLDPNLENPTLHGFNVSLAGNVARHFGIASEYSEQTKSLTLNVLGAPIPQGLDVKLKVRTLLFGPRVTLHRGKVEPFVHALFGVAYASAETSVQGVPDNVEGVAFGYALGGGVDVKVHKNLALRVAQLDYLGARADGATIGNFRFSVGVVIRLGNH